MRSKGRTIDVAVKGSDDFRYLKSLGAEGSINTGVPNHILIREDASKSTLMEEFLHGTCRAPHYHHKISHIIDHKNMPIMRTIPTLPS